MNASIGRIVIYKLTDKDADEINRRRTTPMNIHEAIMRGNWSMGAQAHIGNAVSVGEEFPMVVIRVWPAGQVNGQVLLDGSDIFWARTVDVGTIAGTWHWPERV